LNPVKKLTAFSLRVGALQAATLLSCRAYFIAAGAVWAKNGQKKEATHVSVYTVDIEWPLGKRN